MSAPVRSLLHSCSAQQLCYMSSAYGRTDVLCYTMCTTKFGNKRRSRGSRKLILYLHCCLRFKIFDEHAIKATKCILSN